MTDEVKWLPGGKENVLRVYTDLHKHKLFGEHWAWVAVSRIAAGEPEAEVMADYGYHRGSTPHNAVLRGEPLAASPLENTVREQG